MSKFLQLLGCEASAYWFEWMRSERVDRVRTRLKKLFQFPYKQKIVMFNLLKIVRLAVSSKGKIISRRLKA